MDIEDTDAIQNHKDLTRFVLQLREEFLQDPQNWENRDLDSFLEALAAWIGSMENAYRNNNLPFPEPPSWRTFADMLLAARIYE
ncbi:hypothetical protein HC891_06680 [Candidatus Gracilibacteria bacterium]|nr:hypothetical protein [Candidatus Gracilibacteria bacterium]